MALNFPASPSVNDTYSSGGKSWRWNGTNWESISTTGYVGSRGYTGSQGTTGFVGSRGAQGFTGSQGPIGYTGSAGTNGSSGFTGSQGSVGYTGSGGAWTLIQTQNTTSGSSVTFSSIPSTYQDLYFIVSGMTRSSTNGNYTIELSANGTNWTSADNIFPSNVAANQVYHGGIFIPYYTNGTGFVYCSLVNLSGSLTIGTAMALLPKAYIVTGGIVAVRISTTTATFGGGSISLYAR